ncbi:MAG: bifunctional tRNA (5-methylaminomethyl-2-thiouridine)(34)-methyltransferase MnmD/FAD-dependent 5-carboxymethylaminomethyl-2-thiouridine(34) oxidoreductase MnmC [Gammaproteobacteria bacterium]
MKPLVPARLEWRDGVPYSADYGDIYHSADGGAGQARHVFLGGCGLPGAWAGREVFVVLETGFGTGLNFLATWAAWRADPAHCARLHFISAEKHPFCAADLAQLHARWPEFAPLAAELHAAWPMPVPGFHRIALDGGRVQLTLMLGDAAETLPQLDASVDAFYLDGFAPDRNPDLWQRGLIAALGRLAAPGARAATYTVAAPARDALAQAGFECEKRPGYGRKRHCLAARFAGNAGAVAHTSPRHVAVVGAGAAGAAVAHALAQRGVAVSVLERAAAPAQAASGNPLGVFRPLISRVDTAASRLTRAAFLHNLRAWAALEGVAWARCGVLHLAKDADAAAKQQRALIDTLPPLDFARWVELVEARSLANWPVEAPGVFYPQAGWVEPASLVRAWLAPAAITLKTGCGVAALLPIANGWRLSDAAGSVLIETDAVVLANAFDARALLPSEPWPLHAVRGQVTRLPAGCLPEISRVIAREGYVAPGAQPVVGATYEHDDLDTAPRAASDAANLARLDAILPGASAHIDAGQVSGRAALRATLPDRLPLVGEVDNLAGVYVAAGYASRGLVWAGLLGEALADRITGQPLPLEKDVLRAISPQRFRP